MRLYARKVCHFPPTITALRGWQPTSRASLKLRARTAVCCPLSPTLRSYIDSLKKFAKTAKAWLNLSSGTDRNWGHGTAAAMDRDGRAVDGRARMLEIFI